MSLIRTLQTTKVPIFRFGGNLSYPNSILRSSYNIINNQQFINTTSPKAADVKVGTEAKYISANNESIFTRILKKIPFFNVHRYKLKVSGYLLYESVADNINYSEFFDEFALPDTFYSWFVITEIHVWLLMVRCMAEGDDGKVMRNGIVEAMWSDVGLRARKLGAHNPAGVRAQISLLSEQFQAALIAYDEGLQSNDMVLAGAVWRRLYQQEEANPEHLDCMVNYIRKQIRFLDNISQEDLFSQKKINWEALHKK